MLGKQTRPRLIMSGERVLAIGSGAKTIRSAQSILLSACRQVKVLILCSGVLNVVGTPLETDGFFISDRMCNDRMRLFAQGGRFLGHTLFFGYTSSFTPAVSSVLSESI
jgi:hypothetical protein